MKSCYEANLSWLRPTFVTGHTSIWPGGASLDLEASSRSADLTTSIFSNGPMQFTDPQEYRTGVSIWGGVAAPPAAAIAAQLAQELRRSLAHSFDDIEVGVSVACKYGNLQTAFDFEVRSLAEGWEAANIVQLPYTIPSGIGGAAAIAAEARGPLLVRADHTFGGLRALSVASKIVAQEISKAMIIIWCEESSPIANVARYRTTGRSLPPIQEGGVAACVSAMDVAEPRLHLLRYAEASLRSAASLMGHAVTHGSGGRDVIVCCGQHCYNAYRSLVSSNSERRHIYVCHAGDADGSLMTGAAVAWCFDNLADGRSAQIVAFRSGDERLAALTVRKLS